MTTGRLLLLALLVLAGAGRTPAQDAAPVISRLVVDGGAAAPGSRLATKLRIGSVLVIEGSALPLEEVGLRVTFRGARLTIVHSCPTVLTVVLTPVGGLGRGSLQVELGRETLARFEVEVEEPAPWTPPGPEPPTPAERLADFRVTRFDLVRGRASTVRFVAEGTTSGLPDGFHVDVTLEQGVTPVETRAVWVRGDRWRWTFGPYPEELLLAGTYQVTLRFALDRQPPGLARQQGPQLDAGTFGEILRRRRVVLETPLLAAVQRCAFQAHVRAVCASSEACPARRWGP